MKIAIDAMGGDNAPRAVVEGVSLVLRELPKDTELILFGDAYALDCDLADAHVKDPRVKVVATSEVIGFDEQPTLAIRRKKDSSMVRAIEAVAAGEADCVLSAGSTGALLTGGTLIIKRLKGVKRPALATVLPTMDGVRAAARLRCEYGLQERLPRAVRADGFGVYEARNGRGNSACGSAQQRHGGGKG